jgi:hypothetical protein
LSFIADAKGKIGVSADGCARDLSDNRPRRPILTLRDRRGHGEIGSAAASAAPPDE